MSRTTSGEKTEQPTQRRLEDAIKRGQIPRSAEVQTVFVLFGGLAALTFAGREIWQTARRHHRAHARPFAQHRIERHSLQGYGVSGVLILLKCVGPVVVGTVVERAARRRDSKPVSNCVRGAHAELEPPQSRRRRSSGCFPGACSCPRCLADPEILLHPRADVVGNPQRLERPDFHLVGQRRPAGGISGDDARCGFSSASASLLGVIAAVDYGYQFWRNQPRFDDDQGGIEGGNEKLRRQSANQGRAPAETQGQQGQGARRSAARPTSSSPTRRTSPWRCAMTAKRCARRASSRRASG